MSLDVETKGSQSIIDWNEKYKVTKLGLFDDWLPSIMYTKKNVVRDRLDERTYDAFAINRALSFHQDCLFPANEMNRLPHLPKMMQYQCLLAYIRGYKRKFVPWSKKENNEDVKLLMRHFNYSYVKALQALSILTDDQLDKLKLMYKDI